MGHLVVRAHALAPRVQRGLVGVEERRLIVVVIDLHVEHATQGYEVGMRILSIRCWSMLSISNTNLLAIRIDQAWNLEHFHWESLFRGVQVLLRAEV